MNNLSRWRRQQVHKYSGTGTLCDKCGQPAEDHRTRPNACQYQRDRVKNRPFIGIDGEGVGRENHRYILLSACSENGKSWDVEAADSRLTTIQCLDFIWALPTNARIFAYAFNYDLTKILEDLPDELIYRLFRPDLRKRPDSSDLIPVRFCGYDIDLQSTRFSIAKGRRKVVIWDVFKFYQSKFVVALENWKVGSPELIARMTGMKNKRSEFDTTQFQQIKDYCHEECVCMAQLVRKLVNAHTEAGLTLTSFYGAGSCGAAILKKMGVADYSGKTDPQMVPAISAAFFGGRFENSKIGLTTEPVYNWDISSAYPYQLTFLPCLEHASWELTTDESKIDRYSLVNFCLPSQIIHTNNSRTAARSEIIHANNEGKAAWEPLPFRELDGSICFPASMKRGWCWGQEFAVAKKYWPRLMFRKAWILKRGCDHQPFKDIPHYYRERLRIGKEGAGIVLKLGPNSVYGKLAQSVGRGQFQNWIWAGMVTSGCRSQLLEMIGMHRNTANALMVATDGIFTTEQLIPPIPVDTQTGATGKPLGGWECKAHERGIFCVRPGIYFPPNPTADELKFVKGRGLGKQTVLDNWERISDSWNTYGTDRAIKVGQVTIFCGAKTSVSRSGNPPFYNYKRATQKTDNSPGYGQWYSRTAELSLDPWPKRRSQPNPDGSLVTRECANLCSLAYNKAVVSQDARLLQDSEVSLYEQPDGDFSDW